MIIDRPLVALPESAESYGSSECLEIRVHVFIFRYPRLLFSLLAKQIHFLAYIRVDVRKCCKKNLEHFKIWISNLEDIERDHSKLDHRDKLLVSHEF